MPSKPWLKFRMDKKIFKNCRFLIENPGPEEKIHTDAGLYIEGPWIRAVGPSLEIETRFGQQDGVELIDARDKIVMPGLVDAHNHVAEAHTMLAFGWLDTTTLGILDALDQVYWPAHAWFTEESIYDLNMLGLVNVLKHGATTHANALPFPDAVYQASRDARVRTVIHPQMVTSVQLPDAKDEDEYLTRTEAAIRRYHDSHDGLIQVGVHPNSTFNCTQRMLTRGMALAREYGTQFTTHIAESPEAKSRGDALWADEGGLLAHLNRIGLLSPRTVLFHGTLLDEREIDLLAETDTAIVHCPPTNSLFGFCAYLPYMLKAGIRVGLGTDCPTHNLFNVMLSVSQQHKIMGRPLQSLEPWTPLGLATLGGARALALEEKIGTLEPGKRADLVTIDLQKNTGLFPLNRKVLPDMLSLNGAGTEVADALVDGIFLRRDSEFTFLDERAIIARAQMWCDRFDEHYHSAVRESKPLFHRVHKEFQRW